MQIALFTEGYHPYINGVVTSIETQRAALARAGHQVTIFAPSYPGLHGRDDGVVRLPSVGWGRGRYRLLSPLARSRDVLAGGRFDLVHSHHPFTMGALAVRLARKHDLPLVYTFHTMLHEYGHYASLLEPVARRWLVRHYLRHCEAAERVLVATRAVRDVLQQQGVRRPIEIVAPGVPAVQPAAGARACVRRALGVPEAVPLLLYAGRLAKEKGLDFLLRAVARLDAGRPFRLCLVGGGPMERPLRAQAMSLGLGARVTFAGWVPHARMADYYAAADLFVFPSPTDAMGLVLVEAMSAGLPCVAIDRYGPSEIVVDGLTGLVTPFDERPFSSAIRRLLDDASLRERMSLLARARARDYEPEMMAARLVRVYAEAIAGRAQQRMAVVGRTMAAKPCAEGGER
jgi:1,2-diacylglycerol 3-alpha-glucosyltransferase